MHNPKPFRDYVVDVIGFAAAAFLLGCLAYEVVTQIWGKLG